MAEKVNEKNTFYMDDFEVAIYLTLASDMIKDALKGEENELHVKMLQALDKAIYKYRRELWETTIENLGIYKETLGGEA